MNSMKYIFAVDFGDPLTDSFGEFHHIVIARRSIWDTEKRMDDFAGEGGEEAELELEGILTPADIHRDCEGEYSVRKEDYPTVAMLEAMMLTFRIFRDHEFETWLNRKKT